MSLRMRSTGLLAIAALLISILLTGCFGGLRSDAAPPQVYVLRVTPNATRAAEPLEASLQIARPQSHPGLESERIVLVQADRRMSSYAASRWAAGLPDVVEALAVEAIRSTGAWSTVQDSLSPFSADYLLQITIRRFEADYSGDAGAAPRVYVSFDCTVGSRGTRQVIASFTAEGAAEAAVNRLGHIVAAFEAAANDALATVTERSIEAVRKSKAPSPP